MTRPIIRRDPEVMGGTAVFGGTRVPIKALFDYLETGKDLEAFLDDFPGVSNAQAVGLLAMARLNLTGFDEAATRRAAV